MFCNPKIIFGDFFSYPNKKENTTGRNTYLNKKNNWKTSSSDLYYFYSCNNNIINNKNKNNQIFKNPNNFGGYFLLELYNKLYYNILYNKYQLFNGDIEMIIKKKVYKNSNKLQTPCSITQLQHKLYFINGKN